MAAVYVVAYDGLFQDWSGSGAFIRSDLVATAGHVCDADRTMMVQTYDGVYHEAEVVYDRDKPDVCLLQTKKPAAPAVVDLAPSSVLTVGDQVWYFGYPSGSPGLFYGHYTGHRKADHDGQEYLIAAVSGWFGSSGSALLDKRANVVGVLSEARSNNGVVLAFVPVEALRAAVEAYDEDCHCSLVPLELLGLSLFGARI